MLIEKIQQNKQEVSRKTIEEQANYEGNHSLLMFERLNNPVIFEQLVNDRYEDITSIDYSKYEYVDPDYLKYLNRDEFFVKQDIKKELKKAIDIASKSTGFSYTKNGYFDSNKGDGTGNIGILCSGAENKYNETALSKNITEAHEKGHNIREYSIDSGFSKKLLEAFDFDNVSFSENELNEIRDMRNGYEDSSDEEITEAFKEYFAYPWEIIERMGQIKNYFGMSGIEEFTKEHLDYARKNYVEDTGIYRLQIQTFFDSIIDDEKFIEKMNTLGI